MMRMKLGIFVGCVGLMVSGAALPVLAHHAFSAEFDANKPIDLRGTIVKMEWVNPHTWLHIDVKDPSGHVQSWMIEGGPPTSLLRRGLTKESLKVGSEVNVTGFLAKAGGNKANGRDITFTDGTKLFLGSSGTGAPAYPGIKQ
jgi:hypothetical protein